MVGFGTLLAAQTRPVSVEGERSRLTVFVGQRDRALRLYQSGEVDESYLERDLRAVKAGGRIERRLLASPPQLRGLPTASD